MRQRLGLAAALLGDPELLVSTNRPTVSIPRRALAARLSACLRCRGSHGAGLEPRARRGRPDGRSGPHHQSRAPRRRVLARRAHRPRRRRGARAQPATAAAGRGPAAGGRRHYRRNGHALLALGTTPERVGDIAFAAGVALHELAPRGRRSKRSFSSYLRGRAMIAQTKAELLKIRSTRTTLGLIAGMLALLLLLVLLTGLLSTAGRPGGQGDPAQPARFGRCRRDLRGAGRPAGRDRGIPPRHDPAHLSLHATAIARPWRQAGGEHDHRTGVRRSSPRRSASPWAT